jgi:hypothetical protein
MSSGLIGSICSVFEICEGNVSLKKYSILLWASVLVLCGLSTACSDSNNSGPRDTQPNLLPVSVPSIELPPANGDPALISTTFDLSEVGFVQEEFFLAGTASSFTNLNELGTEGRWEAEPAVKADYRTRVVVYRPQKQEDFSGTVVVEWMNVTEGFDIPYGWVLSHVKALRSGDAWVEVTAQQAGIEGTDDALFPFYLRAADPERYGSLKHPGDSFSYDIFTQVTAVVKDAGENSIVGGFPVQVIMAVGESQSASRLLTYVNAIQPLYAAFDAFLLDSRYDSSEPLSQTPQAEIPAPEQVAFRDDLTVPVINIQSETDVILLGAVDERQPDSDYFRLWEVAGGAHGDNYVLDSGRPDIGTGPEFTVVVENDVILGIILCAAPLNSGVTPWVYIAALDAIDRWVREGIAAPEADRLATTDDLSDYVYDDVGNVLGGVRTPYVDAPAARLSGEFNDGNPVCRLAGTTELFGAATMATRYVDRQGYIDAVAAAADQAVDAGFLLTPDAERIRAAAGLQWDALGID